MAYHSSLHAAGKQPAVHPAKNSYEAYGRATQRIPNRLATPVLSCREILARLGTLLPIARDPSVGHACGRSRAHEHPALLHCYEVAWEDCGSGGWREPSEWLVPSQSKEHV